MKIRIKLTNQERNALDRITSKTKTDCWFSLTTDKQGYDCVYDLEKGYKITLRYACRLLYEACSWMTISDWEDLGIEVNEIETYYNILSKLQII